MPQCSTFGFAGGRDVANKLYERCVAPGGSHGAALYRVDDRLWGEVPDENLVGFDVDVAGGRTDLLIGIWCDVFHEEIQDSGIPLQNTEQLEGTIFRRDDRRWGRRRRRWRRLGGKAQLGDQIFRQSAAE